MPLYEYRCESCQRQFELIRKFSDPPVEACPHCGGGPVVKLLSSPAFQFKGSGWYITDYARKDKGGDKPAESKDAAPAGGGDSKPAGSESTAASPSTPATPAAPAAAKSES